MSLFQTLLSASLGRKYIAAASGTLLGIFLFMHLAGNAAIFFGRDFFQAYAVTLQSQYLVVRLVETGLFLVFLVHVVTGVLLFIQNRRARPQRYTISRVAAARFAGAAMPYTGGLIFIFIMVHLSNFHPAAAGVPLADLVRTTLARPLLAGFYIFALTAMTLHLSHGFWSIFQTFGLSHPKYDGLIRAVSLVGAIGIGAGYMVIIVVVKFSAGFLF